MARSAWTVFLVLFAARAIAGTALCELYGEHEPLPGALHANAMDTQAPHGVADARKHESPTPADQPSHDRDEHVCEESVYLAGEPPALSAVKWSLAVDAVPWSHAPARDWKPAAVPMSVAPSQLAHPPPSRSPLDISSRLHI